MRYASAAAFRSALEAQVRLRSQGGGPSIVRLRKAIAFERLLARLLAVAPDRWMLKGALALDFRLGVHARATMDMDLGRYDDAEAATCCECQSQSAQRCRFKLRHLQRLYFFK